MGGEFFTALPKEGGIYPPIYTSQVYYGDGIYNLLYEAVSKVVYEMTYHSLHMLIEGVLIYQDPLGNLININTQPVEVIHTQNLELTLKDLKALICFYSRDMFEYRGPGHHLLGFLEPQDVLIFSPSLGDFDGTLYLPETPDNKAWFRYVNNTPSPDNLLLGLIADSINPPSLSRLFTSVHYLPYASDTSAFKLVRLPKTNPAYFLQPPEPPQDFDHDPQIWNSLLW
jgi:hypothetical protein